MAPVWHQVLAFFMNSSKDVELNPIPSETDPVVSQEVATVSDEVVEPEIVPVVEPEVLSTKDVAVEDMLEYEVNTKTTLNNVFSVS